MKILPRQLEINSHRLLVSHAARVRQSARHYVHFSNRSINEKKTFTDDLIDTLHNQFRDCEIGIGTSLLYSLFIDEQGNIQPKLNSEKEPVRWAGAGFEQDILLFERVDGYTSIVPRGVAEVKLRGVTTHLSFSF